MIRRTPIGALGVLLLMGACASVPEQQVGLYARAFSEAEVAGNRLYDEIVPVVAAGEAMRPVAASSDGIEAIEPAAGDESALADATCPPDAGRAPYRACFDPARFLDGGAPDEPDSIKARRRALAVVTGYNRLLTRLASGAEGEALDAEVNQLAASVGSFAGLASAAAGPLGSAAGALIGPLVGMVRNIQAGEDLRQAALEGAPIVDRLLDALITDTRRMYALKRLDALGRIDTLATDLKLDVQFPAVELVEARARPTDTSALEAISQRINTALARAEIPNVALVNLAGQAGGQPFDPAAEAELLALATTAETLADAYQAEIDGLNAFYVALGEYVVLLDQTGRALDDVVAAAKAPRSVTVDGAAIASQAAEITLQAREVRRLLGDV